MVEETTLVYLIDRIIWYIVDKSNIKAMQFVYMIGA